MECRIPRVTHLHFICLYVNFFTTTEKYLLFNLSKILHILRFVLRLALGSLFSLLGMSCLINGRLGSDLTDFLQ